MGIHADVGLDFDGCASLWALSLDVFFDAWINVLAEKSIRAGKLDGKDAEAVAKAKAESRVTFFEKNRPQFEKARENFLTYLQSIADESDSFTLSSATNRASAAFDKALTDQSGIEETAHDAMIKAAKACGLPFDESRLGSSKLDEATLTISIPNAGIESLTFGAKDLKKKVAVDDKTYAYEELLKVAIVQARIDKLAKAHPDGECVYYFIDDKAGLGGFGRALRDLLTIPNNVRIELIEFNTAQIFRNPDYKPERVATLGKAKKAGQSSEFELFVKGYQRQVRKETEYYGPLARFLAPKMGELIANGDVTTIEDVQAAVDKDPTRRSAKVLATLKIKA